MRKAAVRRPFLFKSALLIASVGLTDANLLVGPR